MTRRTVAVALVLVASTLAVLTPGAHAGVTTRFVDDDPGSCDDTDGIPFYCTIQAAIDDSGDGDTIEIAAGTFTGSGTVVGDNFNVNDLTINGAGEGITFIDGEGARGGFRTSERNLTVTGLTIIDASASGSGGGITVQNPGSSEPYPRLRVVDVRIQNGIATVDGAGILAFNKTILELERVTVANNDVLTGGDGAGLFLGSQTDAVIVDSTFTSNDADELGGAIHVGGESRLEIYGSTFSLNTAGGDGGAISAPSTDTTILIANSTFSGNTTAEDGGAIAVSGSGAILSIDGSTFNGNTATVDGGALYFTIGDLFVVTRSYFNLNGSGGAGGAIDDGTTSAGFFFNNTLHDNSAGGQGGAIRTSGIVANNSISANSANNGGGVATNGFTGPKVRNTILHGNTAATGDDCYLAVSQGYNLIGDDTDCSLTGDMTGNQIGADPDWSPPADNGGSTFTMEIPNTSVAADAGNPDTPGTSAFSCVPIDQRGYLRDDAGCDIGAFEADATPEVLRYAGSNRYATAAEVSENDYANADAVDEVFIATGFNFPDALAGAAVAGIIGAPLLLVDGGIPAATAAELTRLSPDVITILGGTGAVSDTVETALEGYAPTVNRISGNNRYLTAVEISQYGFPTDGTANIVYVATGLGFADALASASAAAFGLGPVLLVDGTSLNAAVGAEIIRLEPERIVVVGGTAAVSDAVLTALDALQVGDVVERIAGNNRYTTAAAISEDAFPAGAIRAYVATGLNFPDALAGAAAAGRFAAPVLLVPGTSVPTAVSDEITRLEAPTVVILGGTGVVSTGVENDLATLIGAS